MFERTQDALNAGNSTKRQHYLPAAIHKFAVEQQLNDGRYLGRGRGNLPTLADIYAQLVSEGLAAVLEKRVVPVFTEIGRPESFRSVQIKFPNATNDQLIALKERADNGEFEVKPYKQISLISLAVTLMEIAIAERQQVAVI